MQYRDPSHNENAKQTQMVVRNITNTREMRTHTDFFRAYVNKFLLNKKSTISSMLSVCKRSFVFIHSSCVKIFCYQLNENNCKSPLLIDLKRKKNGNSSSLAVLLIVIQLFINFSFRK